MLDSTTKRRIDACRDILVGRVPDPKSQVEQITLALIYKFMDDMDAASEEFGGKRAFFAGEFAHYGWAKLLSPATGGAEMVSLYSESIARMGENPGVPALFRDIFKRAYLPYRDPETLRAFLKEINGFTYEHSEKLGDAFEYLLSVLGSQGDAGQFRTPRHLIDFIVAVVDPQKGETLLDPACGTAGFLISAYKHILAANGTHRPGDRLTPDERTQLARNVTGYDISPDMVRLSLANLYLHGFPDPQVEEYDTLTSDDKWNEYADVILANPPFMSPKGGIRPHKRFSVASSRSEVLFVDYIADHLTPTGRAGVIVPEGIIFQSGSSYKALRKMLVENSLVAVVSLPAGVFQPYSGVKTSVLVLDKRLAKGADSILFLKIASDGFGLGAQRRAVATDDLPEAARLLHAWRESLRDGTEFDAGGAANVQVVAKAKIAASGDYNLSGDRYLAASKERPNHWPIKSLGETCNFMTGGTPNSSIAEYYENGTIPWLVSGDIHKGQIFDCAKRITKEGMANSNAKTLPERSVLIALNGQGKTRGTVAFLRMKNATCNQSIVAITSSNEADLLPEFIYFVLQSQYQEIRNITGDDQRSGLNIPIIKSIQIPLPPLAVQQEIVAEIEGYQKLIDGARQVVENYKPRIVVRPEWPVVEIEELCNLGRGRVISRQDIEANPGTYPVYSSQTTNAGTFGYLGTYDFDGEYVTWTTDGANAGTVFYRNGKFNCTNVCGTLKKKPIYEQKLDMKFLATALDAVAWKHVIQVGNPKLMNMVVARICVPLPDLDTQRAIVAEIEEEQGWVDANKALLLRFEAKIKATIGRVWGEDAAG